MKIVAVLGVVSVLLMLPLRWIDPPTTAFMAANPDGAIQQSVPIEHVSRNFLAAVIAHEDAQLPYRAGAFEWGQLVDRAGAHRSGDEDPSGSTIPQQVAKNLFLNQEPSAWRKAVEAALSTELALMLDDRRMLELYVNYAQFGPTIYGVCAASWYYFDTPPQQLPVDQAVQLVGLLPSPRARPACPRRWARLRCRGRPRLALPLARRQRAEPGAAPHRKPRLPDRRGPRCRGARLRPAGLGRRLLVTSAGVAELIAAEGTA